MLTYISNIFRGRIHRQEEQINYANLADFLQTLGPSQQVNLQIIDRCSFRGVIEYPIKKRSDGITAEEAAKQLKDRKDMHLSYVWGAHTTYSGRGSAAHRLYIRTGSVNHPWSEFSIECLLPN